MRDPATLPLVAPQMAEADQGGILFETVHRRQDGSSFPVEVSSSGATIGDDRVLLSSIRDITDRKHAEAALQQSETRFRLAARATNDVIWDWDLGTDTVAWSEAIATLFGYAEAVMGTDASWWKGRIHPDERQRVVRSIAVAINSGQVHWAAEYRFQHADASYAEVFNRGFVVHNAHGVPSRMIGAMLDLTERKRGEQALRRGGGAWGASDGGECRWAGHNVYCDAAARGSCSCSAERRRYCRPASARLELLQGMIAPSREGVICETVPPILPSRPVVSVRAGQGGSHA